MAATVLTDSQKTKVTVTPLDKAGLTARIDGAVSGTSTDEDIVTVSPDPDDKLSVEVFTTGTKLGPVQVQITGDADLSTGVRPIVATADFEVVGGEAVSFAVTVGTPEERL